MYWSLVITKKLNDKDLFNETMSFISKAFMRNINQPSQEFIV